MAKHFPRNAPIKINPIHFASRHAIQFWTGGLVVGCITFFFWSQLGTSYPFQFRKVNKKKLIVFYIQDQN